MHYYNFNIGDYAKHARYLAPLEDLAYRRLLDECYLSEQPLPLSIPRIARAIGMPEHQGEIEAVLGDFFEKTENGYVQRRVMREIAEYHAKAEVARNNGKLGGRPKKDKTSLNNELPSETPNPTATAVQPSEKQTPAEAKPKKTQSVILANPEQTTLQADGKLTNNQEPITNKEIKDLCPPFAKTQKDERREQSLRQQVQQVFDYWFWRMGKNANAKLSDDRARKIAARLKDGYSVETLKRAIDGCANSPHHMGQNDSGTVYDDLTLICRSASKVEQFANNIAKVTPLPVRRANPPQTQNTDWIADIADQLHG